MVECNRVAPASLVSEHLDKGGGAAGGEGGSGVGSKGAAGGGGGAREGRRQEGRLERTTELQAGAACVRARAGGAGGHERAGARQHPLPPAVASQYFLTRTGTT
jgi:hypothetical protein